MGIISELAPLVGLLALVWVIYKIGNNFNLGLSESHPKIFATIVFVALSPIFFVAVGAVGTILAGVEFGQWYFAKLYFPIFGWIPYIDRIVSLI